MKSSILYRLFYFLLFILSISCKSGLDTRGNTNYLSSIDSESFKKIPLTPGNLINTIKVNDKESEWKYDLTIPQINEGQKVPLFIVLHGGVGSKNYTKFNNCLVTPGLQDAGGFIFSPSGAWRTWTLDYLEKRILDFIDLAKENWPIDPNKIVLVGYSNGAIAGWQYAKDYPDIFSAMILMGSSCRVEEKLDIPIYVIQGTKDKFFPIKKVRKRIAEAKALGCNITFVEAKGNTHLKACEYKEILSTSISWMEKEVWKTK
ncbi:Alpha/beta hydrolase family protein [Aquimarina amphilecti]|uniref:Alpha/beta hydrolase family protein n=1 Tax=Aquimarina amphilecti TaxID=1038014 RepID=A0A1H7TE87_AQUAM|nr:alpha/beta fold hydrolase [Aquimarina amphilecti]SEL83180.1 Alpha/beta hydrolase family protein [Aquimarina amphilecti]